MIDIIKGEVAFLKILCLSGGINDVAMEKVFARIKKLEKFVNDATCEKESKK